MEKKENIFVYLVLFFVFIILLVFLLFFKNNIQKKLEVGRINRENAEYQVYNREVSGAELISLINKAYNNNVRKNKDEKDVPENKKGFFPNGKDTVIVDVEIDGTFVQMYKIIEKGPENFFTVLHEDRFKCMNIRKHSNGHISYMRFVLINNK